MTPQEIHGTQQPQDPVTNKDDLMLIDLFNDCVTPSDHKSNTAKKIFLSNTDSTNFLPLLPHNALSNTTQQLNTLSISESSSQHKEIEDTYLERSDLNNYYYFR